MLIVLGVSADRVNVMVVAEFPVHHGREMLKRRGFGIVDVKSLLILMARSGHFMQGH
jgi:hypothetical protein